MMSTNHHDAAEQIREQSQANIASIRENAPYGARYAKLIEHTAHGVTLFVWPGTLKHLNRLNVPLNKLCALVAGGCHALGLPTDAVKRVNVSARHGVKTTTTGSWNAPVSWLELRIGTGDDPGLEELRGTIWHELRHAWQEYHKILRRDGEGCWHGGNGWWTHYFYSHEYDALLWESQVCASARDKLVRVNVERAKRNLSAAPVGEIEYFAR